MKYTKRMAK